jgi:hypothetical protein
MKEILVRDSPNAALVRASTLGAQNDTADPMVVHEQPTRLGL